jgi:hypothetical protein
LKKPFDNKHTQQNQATPNLRSSTAKRTRPPQSSSILSNLLEVLSELNSHTLSQFSQETAQNITPDNSKKETLLKSTSKMPKSAQTSAPDQVSGMHHSSFI